MLHDGADHAMLRLALLTLPQARVASPVALVAGDVSVRGDVRRQAQVLVGERLASKARGLQGLPSAEETQIAVALAEEPHP